MNMSPSPTGKFPVVVIGASRGGLDAVRTIIEGLPRDCGAAFALVFHVGRGPNLVPEILNWRGSCLRSSAGMATPSSRGGFMLRRPISTWC
jgi:two-component system, chemotaxis family, protein-glutamate methylesterase/glutaminase